MEGFFVRELPIRLLASKVAYLVRVECVHWIKPMVVEFCWRCNWAGGISINVLTHLISFGKNNPLLQ